ncbi:MAG: hypothetical protein A2487_15305 [Candidatus Raymondbacteria bacterium RifOxyC12_full_50_8]|uniref:Uncharacterized protein n=1 Tax=Candidatus Raymondbacteria bacterium RIFOXYD12_FULL_49_13 TaxID=1817890 RepID=A0A1F7FGW6_UNCRA|nr:MAG: hypothetical protein A2248_05050 [Candidatus Raymondbacteria bacterium RIFOXYA2_FULL_49_16]OGJ94517.1 MAG: hypothetical protein A2487_15305 [Candidatus Raymondbacteria bacterium RifOxyC12_full_50_8]OGJ99271.1 MAG: hypothetical protein A2350_05350 [Candidatus Raymondbacteria bacterium RifOxyB12_full_50_8]OGK05863.1 MAG: hypothetical protein A2519_04225 [Candidatus Raymondbacteria bacterium RIFOXYD12_FULL_49_13]OGP43357.1 MAG: hypothetical protein A2324_02690 [Candidatus Raymondbacteria b
MVKTENGFEIQTYDIETPDALFQRSTIMEYPKEDIEESYDLLLAQHLRAVITKIGTIQNAGSTLKLTYNPHYEITRRHLENLVSDVALPKTWKTEGLAEPNQDCKQKSKEIIYKLFDEYRILPLRVAASVENGIFFCYKDPVNSARILSIEVYNDLDVAAVISEGKTIVASFDIENDDYTPVMHSFNA